MADDTPGLAAALGPLVRRVRTDVTAIKHADGVQAWTDQALTPERLRASRKFDAIGMALTSPDGRRRMPAVPNTPHRWGVEISAWACGHLVQWRYVGPETTDMDWRDCSYPSQGEPNWWYDAIEFRVAP